MTDAVVDNDALIKLACYRFLQELVTVFGGSRSIGILGAARFVVKSHIRRNSSIRNQMAALACFETFLTEVDELEPTVEEIELATTIEDTATHASVALDFGESQLCAIVLLRIVPVLLTGDKRAITAAEALKSNIDQLTGLAGKMVCLEQLVLGITERAGHAATRAKICAEPDVDKTLTICFSCLLGAQVVRSSVVEGLMSYIGNLRLKAPTLLHPQEAVPPNS